MNFLYKNYYKVHEIELENAHNIIIFERKNNETTQKFLQIEYQ